MNCEYIAGEWPISAQLIDSHRFMQFVRQVWMNQLQKEDVHKSENHASL